MQRRSAHLSTAALGFCAMIAVWVITTQVFPYHSLNHDEGVYLQQAAMLLEGQLNLYPPVEGVFRPWFFVEDGDRLYPKYAPVPAAMFALGGLLGNVRLALPAIAAANVLLVVAVVHELFDRPTGLLAGGFVLASPIFLIDSSVFLPYAPTTLLNLVFAYGYFRADRTADRRWATIAGVGIGLAFFARPYTAVLFGLPFIGHALWRLAIDWRTVIERQAIIAGLALAGVLTALQYNALMTGSPWLFPYQAFAPLDGLGFGHRRILGHEIRYTPELALRANRENVRLFFSEWIAGGVFGTGLAVFGLAHTIRQHFSPRRAVLIGLVGTIVVGNLYFWGTFNLLGDIDRAGDGLIAAFGPYYHFDLLVPTAALAAVGIRHGTRILKRILDTRFDRRVVRSLVVGVLVISVVAAGSVTAADFDERVDENMEATTTYETVYAPFEGGPPTNSLVLLPDPYGDWLNHPFQPLRNEPGFDGRAVYAIDDAPFEVANTFPDRRLYRYVYRGAWAPYDGSPEAARLQRVRDVSGDRVRLGTTVGIPDGAIGVTVRLEAGGETAYYVAEMPEESLDINLTVSQDTLRVTGDIQPVGDETLSIADRDVVGLTVFVDYGAGGGFSYRFDLPVSVTNGQVRALSPRIERCRNARACGGAAAYIPESAPEGVFVRTTLVGVEPNP
ncbi:MAG: glycosyltransferase family 39 protein [Halobacteriales archaeon]|nr:glycosyltransferase family 39 protein [Halobacteriales archaeon]